MNTEKKKNLFKVIKKLAFLIKQERNKGEEIEQKKELQKIEKQIKNI